MTDELQELREKLAIAEEIAGRIVAFGDVNLGDVAAIRALNAWAVYGSKPGVVLAEHECLYTAIRQARKKLAERAEAAKSERENRLETGLRDVLTSLEVKDKGPYFAIAKCIDIARQALES